MAPANSPNMKGEIMKNRKTKQCIAELRAILKRGDLEPEQEKAVEFAIQRLKELNRLRAAAAECKVVLNAQWQRAVDAAVRQ